MKWASAVMFVGALLAAPSSFAVTVSNTEIGMIMIDRGHGAKVFIRTTVAKPTGPSCHNSTWAYVLPLVTDVDKTLYSTLLAAKAASAKVNLVGSGECGIHTAIETLTRIEYQ